MPGGPVAAGNGLQAGNKSAITGILMTSFAAFGALLSIPALSCTRVVLTLALPIRRVCVFGAGLTRRYPHHIVIVSSSGMTQVSYLASRK